MSLECLFDNGSFCFVCVCALEREGISNFFFLAHRNYKFCY